MRAAFAAAGARLVLSARRHERLEALAGRLGAEAHVLALDVRDRAAVEAVLAELPAEWDAVDVLVNNAGLAAGLSRCTTATPTTGTA